jgi:anthranilate synthase/aminodeoxychorismate synthase-like glutamine amidotransferase
MAPLAALVPRLRPAQHRLRLASSPPPVAAYAALRPFGAALLEGRGRHPQAQTSYVAFNARAELWATPDRAFLKRAGEEAQPLPGAPWMALMQALEQARGGGPADPAFQGGWVGYLSHEAGAWILGTPRPPPAPPARPGLPLAHFRLYADALAIDASGAAELIANDFGEESQAGGPRLEEAARRLASVPSRSPPARALDRPVRTLETPAFERRVKDLQALVRAGDCFQVNLTSSFAYPWAARPSPDGLLSLYDVYASSNPGAWGAFYETPEAALLSSSPECLVDVRGDRVRLRPMAGTRPRGSDPASDEARARELRTDPKERAEHAMLVDLARNDAARLCRPGTVEVPNLGGVERYRHVMHLVSEVEGRAQADLGLRDVLEAVFPGGTVTGAPKRRAVQRIAELEPGPRGPYTGALGYVSVNGSTQWNLLIRTLVATPTHLVAHAGCGIVEASRPAAEADELLAKARAQVEAALGRAAPAPPEAECGRVEAGPRWRPPAGTPLAGRRVLLVDHEDSFVQNLADYCARLGATTRVVSAHDPAADAWRSPPTHVVLSPGPGRPGDFPQTRRHIDEAQRRGVPVLGVCLGHQALAEREGARIDRHPETVHGRASPVRLTSLGRVDPVLARWRGDAAARYHSLVARDLPPTVAPLAELEDGTCMALRVRGRPQWGLQFHPESLLTEDGLALVRAFLEVPRDV